MTNAIIGFPRWTAEATYTAGSAASGYPASNLGTLPLSYPWRSGGLETADCTVTVTLPSLRRVGLIVIGPHNFSAGSTIDVAVYRDTGLTDLIWGDTIPVWPSVFTADQVDWDGGRWWDRTYTADEIAGYPWYLPIALPEPAYARAVVITIHDPVNPAGYVQAGLLEIADAFIFPVNFEYGAQYGYRGRTETQEADGGTKYRRRRAKPRVATCNVPYAPRDTALGGFLEMQRQLDIDTPFFWWPRPDEALHTVRTAFLAHFTELDLQSYAVFGRDGVPIRLEEEL